MLREHRQRCRSGLSCAARVRETNIYRMRRWGPLTDTRLPRAAERNRRGSGALEEPAPARLSAFRLRWRGPTPRWPRSLRLGSASGQNIGSRAARARGFRRSFLHLAKKNVDDAWPTRPTRLTGYPTPTSAQGSVTLARAHPRVTRAGVSERLLIARPYACCLAVWSLIVGAAR